LRKNIKAKLVKKNGYRWYLYLPVNIGGKEVGHIKAQIHKPKEKDIPSYINASGTWSLTSGLFPLDYAVKLMEDSESKSIVLVEGPRDALRLCSLGIPCVAILGTHSWSDRKTAILSNVGVERVVSCFDGDLAGKIATRLIVHGERVLEDGTVSKTAGFEPLSSAFDIKEVKLWNIPIPENHLENKLDPGNIPINLVEKIKKLLV
jgi:Toprim-like